MSNPASQPSSADVDGPSGPLLAAVYDELRRLAAGKMTQEREGHTLQATALVHEAWLRLGRENRAAWSSRECFLRAAAQAMRRILIEHARRRRAERHGGGLQRENIPTELLPDVHPDDEQLLALDEALTRLAAVDARKAELVNLRYFGGLTNDEIAAAMDLSMATVKREWVQARAWLFAALQKRC